MGAMNAKRKSKERFEVALRPGAKLSTTFANSRDCFKVVEDDVLGYVVSPGGRDSTATIWPLYRADVHVKAGKAWTIVSSYDLGDRLNGYTYHVDYEGCTFASMASMALRALEERRAVAELVELAKKRGKKRRGKRGRKRR